MEYDELVSVYEDLDSTSSRLELTDILATAFQRADGDQLGDIVKLLRGKVFENWESEELGVSTSLAREAIGKATGIDEEQIESWWREEGDLGSAAAIAVEEKSQRTLFSDQLTVSTVHDTLQEIASYEGEGSQDRKVSELAGLVVDAEPAEAKYIIRTVVGAMRLGVGEGLIRDGIAVAFLGDDEDSKQTVQRAYEVTNDFRLVATKARDEGKSGLVALDVEVFRPIKPMLAQKATSIETALADLGDSQGEVLFESKYDGIRAKFHSDGEELQVFTRRLEDVTEQFPDVVRAIKRSVNVVSFIIEGELVAYNPDTGNPLAFQELSQRIKRKYEIEQMAEEVPVTIHLFDAIYIEGESLLNSSLRERLTRLAEIFTPLEGECVRAEHIRTASLEDAEAFYESILASGHEGMMAKNLDAEYQPGSRVGYQQKIKPTMEPLDLVVTRAKWSEGRKSDYLGRPYLACRDETTGEFKEVGRMHTGFTDEQLEEFHGLVEPYIETVQGREAKLKPRVVLEVKYEEIQESSKYGSGYALRFPRLSRIRHDLDPLDVDTLSRVVGLYQNQM